MKNKTVLITGGTGFLGTQIVLRLLKETPHTILVLVRGKNTQSALRHLKRSWWEFPKLIDAINHRIHLLNGDLNQENLSLDEEGYHELIKKVTHIIHTAADLRLNAPMYQLRKTNYDGTLNILKLGHRINEDHGLERFSHVSTAYVAGGRKGLIKEETLSDDSGFISNYEKSKYESEFEVRKSKLPFSIFRPGMIVGDSSTGYVKTFNTLYSPLKIYLSGKQRFIPLKPSEKVNMIPVDYVADAIFNLTFKENSVGLTFHLTAPRDILPTADELIKFLRGWAQNNLDFKLPSPLYVPKLSNLLKKVLSSRLVSNNQTKRAMKTMETLSPYFQEDREFSITNTRHLFGEFSQDWRIYLPNLLNFAAYNGFFHRSERTVHEQIMFRLKSRSRPVKYYEIIENQVKKTDTSKVEEEITKAVLSLKKLGVKKGDRLALVGYNSTRYLILDIAIGLVGGVSVPLYYTSPYEEIKEIIADSGASLIFVGIPELIEKISQDSSGITSISFSRIPLQRTSKTDGEHIMMGWDDFISLGLGESEDMDSYTKMEITAPVDFDDLATIRYTSGTTGTPRGVTYTHDKLRWMAEYIASMPPWKDRIHTVSYLSFLPMNHVVEGIIGLYGPYYAPAPINIYFLENFQDLPQVLPDVKPNIFFSVPRFYEKLWNQFSQTWQGKNYNRLKDGIIKKFMGKIIKPVILKKAGLDRCAQLIVGSAPVSEDLLQSYHYLGIEIYNAYGLTEAPLITINRLKNNHIGTVGKPLPKTEIKTSSDGEIMVKGPQVMSGYYDSMAHSPFEDGWLLTGDYGNITPEGDLIIKGRKKEVLINAYGKTISPLKIEAMLKDVPGVEEAMLIGEGKPYCSAILWFEEAEFKEDVVKERVKKINTRISRPEQIKTWTALNNDLSIEEGDLTANLKLKRQNITHRYQDLIESIYNDSRVPEYVLHMEKMHSG